MRIRCLEGLPGECGKEGSPKLIEPLFRPRLGWEERENGANDAEPEHAFFAPLPLPPSREASARAEARRGGSDLGRLIEQGIRRGERCLSGLSTPSKFRGRRGGSGPVGL